MNNRYICRGKRKDNGEWIKGNLINCAFFNNEGFPMFYILDTDNIEYDCWEDIAEEINYLEVIPETVGQCTGLKDKNRKLIFEGDIIITNKFNTPEIRYTIVYDKEIATFIGGYKKGCVKHFTTFEGDSNCFEVIGNIYDNPELLEVGK